MCEGKGGPRNDVGPGKTNVQQRFGKVNRGAHGDRQGINPDLGPYHENVQKQRYNDVSMMYLSDTQG